MNRSSASHHAPRRATDDDAASNGGWDDTPAGIASAISHRLATAPWSFDFFAAVRWIESRHPDRPRVGAGRRLADDALRLGQSPALCFAPATLDAAQPPDTHRPWCLSVRFFGLWGPQGALPLHLTERVHERTRRQPADPAAAAFADVFHHRLLCLLHRAWAQGRPAASADRRATAPADREPAGASWDDAGTAADAAVDDDPIDRQGRALQLRPRSADALRDALHRRFRCPVRVRAAPPRWLRVPRPAQCRLCAGDARSPGTAPAILGVRTRVAGQALRIDLGPLPIDTWRRWSGPMSAQLRAQVRALVDPHLSIDLRLLLPPGQAPPPRLRGRHDGPRLGHDLWVGGADPLTPADAHGWRLD